jgi:hypothetical protein
MHVGILLHTILLTYYVLVFSSGGLQIRRKISIAMSTMFTVTLYVAGSLYQPIRYDKYINTLARAMHMVIAPTISHPVLSLRIVRVSRGPRHTILLTYYVPGALLFIMQIYKIFSNKKNPLNIFLFRGFVLL